VVRLARRRKECNPGAIRFTLDGLVSEVRDHNRRLDRIERGLGEVKVDISWLKKTVGRVESWIIMLFIGIITTIIAATL